MRAKRLRQVVGALGQFPFDARTHFVALLALIAYCVYQVIVLPSFAEWDWHKISALALAVIGIRVAARIDELLSHALRRLCVRGVIACSENELGQLNRTLALLRRKWAPACGISIGLAIVLAFVAGWDWKVIDDARLVLLAIEAPIFYAAGYYIGWMIIQGRLARVLRTLDIRYSVQPGHPDGAAGLKPLGDFFFRQAMLTGMPAAYLALWIVLQRPVAFTLILLPLFVLIEVAAFVWPMWAFHRVMVRQKRSLVTQADEIAHRISSTKVELRKSTNPDQVKELNARLTLDLKLYEELDNLPTWPVSKQTRRRFAVQNLILVAIPVLGLLVGDKTTLLEALKQFFGGG